MIEVGGMLIDGMGMIPLQRVNLCHSYLLGLAMSNAILPVLGRSFQIQGSNLAKEPRSPIEA